MSQATHARRKPRGFIKQVLSAVTVVAMSLGFVGLTSAAATAAPADRVTASLLNSRGESLAEGTEVREGDPLKLRIDYTHNPADSLAGKTVTFAFTGLDLDITEPNLVGNDAVKSIVVADGVVTITFNDPWPDIANGYFEADFTISNVEQSGEETVSWTIDESNGGSLELIVVEKNDEKANVSAGAIKTTGGASLTDFVKMTRDGANNNVFDTLDCTALTGMAVNYSLTLNVPEGTTYTDYVITDELPAGLVYVGGSAAAQLTQWDENGWNKTTAPFTQGVATKTATGFTYAIPEVAGPAVLTVNYQSEFDLSDPAVCADLTSQLQAEFDKLNGASGGFKIKLENTATFPEFGEKKASISMGNSVPGPNVGAAFGKSDDLEDFYVETDADGTILRHGSPLVDGPVDITYTLKADLRQWTNENGNYTLQRNVVVTDTLPATASWSTNDAAFLTLNPSEGNALAGLTKASTCPTDFSGNEFVNQYCVDGQTFKVNLGTSNTTNVNLALKAQLNTVDETAGMRKESTTAAGGQRWSLTNTAKFEYLAQGGPFNSSSALYPTMLPDDATEGINDSRTFTKSAPKSVQVSQGESATIPYTFTVNTALAGFSPSTAEIVDHVDTTVFDLGENLSKVGVSGDYNGSALTPEDFTLAFAGGDLTIRLSDSGIAKVSSGASGKTWTVRLSLQTIPLQGKSTLEVTNRATLRGSDTDHFFWSEQESNATSYGNEAEARKVLIDPATGAPTSEIPVKVDKDGVLADDANVFVYQLSYIGHGSYSTDIDQYNLADMLPKGAEFLGFVNADELTDPAQHAKPGPIEAGGNIIASYDSNTHSVTLKQKPGTRFSHENPAQFYFAVKVASAEDNVVNDFIGKKATIVPYGDPSIDIEKWNTETDGVAPEYDADGKLTNDGYEGDFDDARGKSLTADTTQAINFTISNDGKEPLKQVVVSDTLVDGEGTVDNLSCVFPDKSTGTTWDGPFAPGAQFKCTGELSGVSLGKTHQNRASVSGIGIYSDEKVTDKDDWNAHVKSFAVGDYVWIDSNRDGIQDADESPLSGVQVELLDENGEPIEGRVTTTDERGRYSFDNLPAGTYQVRFTLTEEQGERYRYTTLNPGEAGENAASDSNATVDSENRLVGTSDPFVLDETNTSLTESGDYEFFDIEATDGIDPTWDAGVTEIQYAVGDYVWIDADKDGVQDAGEKPLSGVKVELLDGDGNVVATTTTDNAGRYIFDGLFAGTYQVRFTLTPEQARWYEFTKTGSGDAANDSNAHVSGESHIGLSKKFELGPDNLALTQDYDREFWASEGIDPTWDAGVIVRPEVLSETGSDGGVLAALLGTGGILLLGGGLLMLRRRGAKA